MLHLNSFKRTDRQALRSLLLIWGLTAASCLFLFSSFLFGENLVVFNDAGSDTRQQYLMQYSSIINHLRTGNLSFWDLNNGFGTSMFALNLTNPFLMLVYLAGLLFGVGRISGVIVYLLIAQIFLAATFCYLFLSCFSFSEKSKVTASYIYGLNGYILIWGQHYQFGSFVVFLPLLLFLLERAVRKKRFSLTAPLLIAVMVSSSVYMSYMSLLMAGFYLIYRMVLQDGSRMARIRQFLMHCLSMVLGIGIGSTMFLPMAYYLMTISSRLDSGTPLLERLLEYLSPFPAKFYLTAFLRLFSTSFQGIGNYRGYSNYYEAPVLFFSALFVILVLQYLFTIHRQKTSTKTKVMQYLAVLFFVFCFLIRAGASAFNAFAYPFSRHSFLFMPMFALITAWTLDQILDRRILSIPALFLSAAVILAAHYIAYTGLDDPEIRTVVLVFLLCALLMLFLLVIGARIKSARVRGVIPALLLLAVVINVSVEGHLGYNHRQLLTTADPQYWGGLFNPNVTAALDYLHETDPSLYRLEKDYYSGSYCMDGMAQNYRGISTYNSTPNKNLEEFINLVIPNLPIMAKYEYTYRQIGYYTDHASLFGIKYLLSREPDLQLDGFTLLKQFGDIYLYRREDVDSMARFYTSIGDSAVLQDAYGTLDLERMLLEVLLLDDVQTIFAESDFAESDFADPIPMTQLKEDYALEEIPLVLDDITADGSSDQVTIELDRSVLDAYERVYLEFDISAPVETDISVNNDEPMEYHFRVQAGSTRHVQIAVGDAFDSISLLRFGGKLEGSITNLRLLGSSKPAAVSDGASVTLTDSGNDSILRGTVQSDKDGFLFLPIPYENGWTAELDGEEITIVRSDVGFMSIPVTAGEHTFLFTYQQPYMQTGFLLCMISTGIWVLLAGQRIWKKRRNRMVSQR